MLPYLFDSTAAGPLGVVPVLTGPLVALWAILPGLLLALGGLVVTLFKPSTVKKLLLLLLSQWLAVLIIVGVGVGVYHLAPQVFSSKAKVGDLAEGTDWPLWRGSVQRRGAMLDAEDPAHGGVRWRFTDGKTNTFYASPAIVGNRLYITSVRVSPFNTEGWGAVYSIDVDTGEVVWKYDADGYRATFSSPAVSGRYLVVGEGLHDVRDGRVVCLDIEASEAGREGVKLWEFRSKSHVESSPAIGDGRVCIGAGDDGLYCFALAPGKDGKANVLWHLEGEKFPDCESSPAIHDGRVYFGLGLGGNALCCVDAKTGAELWRVSTPYPAFGSPTIADGKVYVGMGTGNYIQTAEDVQAIERQKLTDAGKTDAEIEQALKRLAPAGEVWAVDATTHEVAWKFRVKRTVLGAIAAADGKLYFGSRDGHVYCLAGDGKLRGKWNTHAPIITSPAVGKDHVYVVTETGTLYALTLPALEPVWEIDLMSRSLSSPVVAQGHVFVGTDTNGLLSLGEPGGVKQKPIWRGRLDGPGRSGWTEGDMLSAQGRFAWRWPAEAGKAKITSPIAHMEGALYVGIEDENRKGLLRLQLPKDASAKTSETWFCAADNPVVLSPAAAAREDDALVFFVDGRPGDKGRLLRCVRGESGELAWSAPVASDATGRFVITRRELLVADRPDGLTRYPLHVATADWSRDFGSLVGVPFVRDEVGVIAVNPQPRLIAFDVPSGRTLWKKSLKEPPTAAPVVAGGKIWLGDKDGLAAYDLVTGEQLLKVDAGAVTGRLLAEGARIACTNGAGELLVADTSSGKELLRVDKIDGALPPMLAGDDVLYYNGKAILRRPVEGKASTEWLRRRDFSWMGKPTAPIIVVNANIYLATDRMGLMCIQPKKEP